MANYRRVLYVSTASGEWRNGLSAVLANIVVTCTHFNKEHHVTGLLSFRSGNFLQVIEGAPGIITQLMSRISRDPRHSEMEVLCDDESESRSFDKWLYRLAPSSEMPPEFIRFVNARYPAIKLKADKASIDRLKLFYKPSRNSLSAIPGVSLRGNDHLMSIDGTTPGITRGLDAKRLDVVGLLLSGWQSFHTLRRESGLEADELDSLLLRFRESGLLRIRNKGAQVNSSPPEPGIEGGFYATLRRFLLRT